MSKKVSIEIKAAVLNHFLTEKCSIASLSKYAFEKYKIDVSRQAISKWVKNKLGFKINDFMIISIHLIYSRNKYEFENLFKDAILENRENFAPNIKKRSKTLKNVVYKILMILHLRMLCMTNVFIIMDKE